jgi:adenine-specific DNA-methyltransferase
MQRPDTGVEAQFPNKKAPKTYRYDSSLAPELCWDENAERPFAEWLLNLVALAGTVSEPFALGDKQRIAVKVIDDRGNELMVVKEPAKP